MLTINNAYNAALKVAKESTKEVNTAVVNF